MTWRKLSSWFVGPDRTAGRIPMPFTLVTLCGRTDASRDEVAFYSDAELAALRAWAASGRFVMAFCAEERDELTLVCTGSVDMVRAQLAELPMVAAGLASADIRAVSSLHLTRRVPLAH